MNATHEPEIAVSDTHIIERHPNWNTFEKRFTEGGQVIFIDTAEPVRHTKASWRTAFWIFAVTAVLAACVMVVLW